MHITILKAWLGWTELSLETVISKYASTTKSMPTRPPQTSPSWENTSRTRRCSCTSQVATGRNSEPYAFTYATYIIFRAGTMTNSRTGSMTNDANPNHFLRTGALLTLFFCKVRGRAGRVANCGHPPVPSLLVGCVKSPLKNLLRILTTYTENLPKTWKWPEKRCQTNWIRTNHVHEKENTKNIMIFAKLKENILSLGLTDRSAMIFVK